MPAKFLFVVLSLMSAAFALPGVQAYAGVSCGFEDCAQNLTTATVTLGGCYSSCHPCMAGQCQYQYFQPLDTSGSSFQQFLCGNDATCNLANCSAYLNYTCGTCVNLTLNTNYRFAVKVTCPIQSAVGGNIDCGTATCRNQSQISASLNKCYQFCNPCSQVCEYVTFQAYGTTVMSYNYPNDPLCLPGNAVFKTNYTCDVCSTVIQGQSVVIPCPQTTNALISQRISEPVVASASATIINSDPNIPSGVTIDTLNGASVGVDGVFSVNVPITTSATLSPAQLQALKDVIAANIAQQFNILPVSRVTVTLSKKRDMDSEEQLTNQALVVVQDTAGSALQLPLMVLATALFSLALIC